MNSLDLYDFTVPPSRSSPENAEASSSSSSTAAPETAPSQPSLNEEVTQVIGQLGRLWGGVRKQSQTAFESARKDFGGVVIQAQRELEKFSQRPSVSTATPAQVSEEKSADVNSDSVAEGTNTTPAPAPEPEGSTETIPTSSSFFSRIQNSLPPNLTPTALSTTLQRHLPENLQHGLNLENANADFSHLRATLASNIQRVQQGTTVQQAEKLAEQYMQKGGALFKEAGEFLKDAVKVVPPEGNGETPGLVWDGSDMWAVPTPIQTTVGSSKGKDKEIDVIFSVPKAAAKRVDVLLKKLRSDPDILRQDPGLDDDESVRMSWAAFVKDEVDAQGGMGGDEWMTRIGAALEDHDKNEDVQSLTSLRDQLVPAEFTTDAFWTRYFFRVHQIEHQEERRKALLAGANQDEEDFSWEDEDDGEVPDDELSRSRSTKTPVNALPSASPKPSMDSAETITAPRPAQNTQSATSQSTSPRESEDSYDVVSSGNVSSTSGKVVEKKKAKESDDNGDDSDWE